MVLAAAAAGSAWADCTPLPAVNAVTTTCSGTSVGPITVSTSTPIVVERGALLHNNASTDQAALIVTSVQGAPATVASLLVDGSITGGARASGVNLRSGATNYSYPTTRLDITVSSTGTIDGFNAIAINGWDGPSGFKLAAGTLDNSGSITGVTSAIYASDFTTGGLLSVNNRAGGVISGGYGGILAPVGSLVNAGLIDGGQVQAYGFYGYNSASLNLLPYEVINTGTMRANSFYATVYLTNGSVNITNSGLITSTGYGAAIDVWNNANIINASGGVLETNGFDAVRIGSGSLTNAGVINGGLTLGGKGAVVFDNTGGVVTGNVMFGNGDDVLIGTWDATAGRVAGIGGWINGGGGVNRLQFNFDQDAVVDSLMQVALPTNFQNLGLLLKDDATLTLNSDGFDGLLIGGSGRFVTTGAVNSQGAAFGWLAGPPYDYTATMAFENRGQITSTFATGGSTSNYAVALQNLDGFVNSGTITSLNGAGVSASFYGWSSTGSVANSGSITAAGQALNVYGGALINTGVITSSRGLGVNLSGPGVSTNSGEITGATGGLFANGGKLINSGSIVATNTDGVGLVLSSTQFENLAGGVITGGGASIALSGGRIVNAGVLNGDVRPQFEYSYSNDAYIDEGGKLNGSLRLGAGDDLVVTDVANYDNGVFKNITGVVDGGDGFDRVVLRVKSNATAKAKTLASFERIGYELSNDAALTLTADETLAKTLTFAGKGSIDLDVDFNVVDQLGIVVTTPYDGGYLDPGAVSIISRGDLTFRASANGFSQIGVQLLDQSTFDNRGVITGVGRPNISPANALISGGALVSNAGTISVNGAAAVSSALKVVNTGQITEAAGAAPSFGLVNVQVVENSGTIRTSGSAVTLNYTNYSAPTTLAPSVTNSGLIQSTAGAAIIQYGPGAATITNTASGRIVSDAGLAIQTGSYNDVVVSAGSITGRIDLGAGNDLLRLTGTSSFTGVAEGGAGYDRLELALGGTDASPIVFSANAFSGFELLAMESGVASLAGVNAFQTIQLNGGRLIGQAGSRISGAVTVGQGAVFGSAGTVVGDILVNGVLSPGASPGTMTVVGNVNLGGGSTSLFELTQAASDRLVVSGRVTIAQGATLKLSGAATGLTPGRRLDLISATGGVSGSYATIQGAEGLNLRFTQTADSLQVLGLFTTSTAFSSDVAALVDTLNTAFVADKASASLVAAMPALVDTTTGQSNEAALARVTPQAYASAAQLATENGLAIVDALRTQSRFAPTEPGLFGFGQAFTGRRDFDGDAKAGVAGGKVDGSGMVSGVGYGLNSAWVGAFVGYIDGRQKISALEANTNIDSFVVGAAARVELGGFALGATAAHDVADAKTQRAVPGAAKAAGDYKLKSWAADVNLAYPITLNDGWALLPSLGASYVSTKRGDLVERGGGALGLALQGETVSTWFADGQLELRGGQAAGARLHPYVSVGVRSRVSGDDPVATARINGLNATITGAGLRRERTLGTVGAGLGYDLTARLTVSTSYAGEFGDGGRQAALVGLNWKF